MGQRAELFSDCNLLNGIPKVGGFMSLHLAEEQKVEELLKSGKAASGLLQFLSVSQIASPRKLFEWEAQTNFMPWATIGQHPVFPIDDQRMLSEIMQCEGSLLSIAVFLPNEAKGRVQAQDDPQARIFSSRFAASECVFDTSATARTMLVVAQAYYHCWRASVDGNEVPLWRANYAFQALEIPAGRHQVRLRYVDRVFQTGAVISMVALMTCIGVIWKGPRQRF